MRKLAITVMALAVAAAVWEAVSGSGLVYAPPTVAAPAEGRGVLITAPVAVGSGQPFTVAATVRPDGGDVANAWITVRILIGGGIEQVTYSRHDGLLWLGVPASAATVRPGQPEMVASPRLTLDGAGSTVTEENGALALRLRLRLRDADAATRPAIYVYAQNGPAGSPWTVSRPVVTVP